MNYQQNPFAARKNKVFTYNNIKQSRAVHSEKKFTQASQSQSKQTVMKTQLRALIDKVPQDQQIIENYIQQLKDKLQQMKLSPKKKIGVQIQYGQLLKRKNIQNFKGKVRNKSNDKQKQVRIGSKSLHLGLMKKGEIAPRLLDLNEVRNEVKRSKLNSGERRLNTQKQSNRYAHFDTPSPFDTKVSNNGFNRYHSNAKVRSNTEQVIRSQHNPARIYRHSSCKKTDLDLEKGNSFVFDKIINVHQNINIYSNSQKREAGKNQKDKEKSKLEEKYKFSEQKNTKKNIQKSDIENNQRIGDISTIMAKKETLNMLGDSCVIIKQQLQPHQQQVSKLLDLLGWRTKQLKDAFSSSKQKKRKHGLDKLSKIFPKGFFANK